MIGTLCRHRLLTCGCRAVVTAEASGDRHFLVVKHRKWNELCSCVTAFTRVGCRHMLTGPALQLANDRTCRNTLRAIMAADAGFATLQLAMVKLGRVPGNKAHLAAFASCGRTEVVLRLAGCIRAIVTGNTIAHHAVMREAGTGPCRKAGVAILATVVGSDVGGWIFRCQHCVTLFTCAVVAGET